MSGLLQLLVQRVNKRQRNKVRVQRVESGGNESLLLLLVLLISRLESRVNRQIRAICKSVFLVCCHQGSILHFILFDNFTLAFPTHAVEIFPLIADSMLITAATY